MMRRGGHETEYQETILFELNRVKCTRDAGEVLEDLGGIGSLGGPWWNCMNHAGLTSTDENHQTDVGGERE